MAAMKTATVTLILLTIVGLAAAEDWPQWRGPTGQGIASDQPVPTKWSETENIAWKTPIRGKGWSSPVILGQQIWVTTAELKPDTKENIERRLKANTGNQPLELAGEATFRAICLDRDSGKVVHGNPDAANPESLVRILTKVNGRNDPEGHDADAHQQRHDECAKDCRENPALRIGLARVVGQEDPDAMHEDSEFPKHANLVWEVKLDDLLERHRAFAASCHAIPQLAFVA